MQLICNGPFFAVPLSLFPTISVLCVVSLDLRYYNPPQVYVFIHMHSPEQPVIVSSPFSSGILSPLHLPSNFLLLIKQKILILIPYKSPPLIRPPQPSPLPNHRPRNLKFLSLFKSHNRKSIMSPFKLAEGVV